MPESAPKTRQRNRTSTIRFRTLMLGLGAMVGIFVFIMRYPTAFRMIELRIDDLRMYNYAAKPPAGIVIVVTIDDKSIAAIGRWPWSRERIAKLISQLDSYNVKVIGLDFVLSEAEESPASVAPIATAPGQAVAPHPSGDELLAQAIAKQGAVFIGTPFLLQTAPDRGADNQFGSAHALPPIAGYSIVRQHADAVPNLVTAIDYLAPLPILAHAARGGGFVNIEPEEDLVIRSALMTLKFNDHYFAPLSLSLVGAYLGNAPLMLELDEYGVAGINVGDIEVPVDEAGHMVIKFRRGGPSSFPHYSAVDIIEHRVPKEELAGKIALVGAGAMGLGDVVPTPTGDLMPGVDVHATLIDQILAHDFVRRSRSTAAEELFATVLLTFAAVISVTYLPAVWAGIAGLMLTGGYIGYAQYRLYHHDVLLGVAIPILVIVVTYTMLLSYRYFSEGSERQRLKVLFEHYLHPDVIKQMFERSDGPSLNGQRKHLAILFADIVNFTSRAEQTEPEALVDLLNVYMTEMTDSILAHQGVVDKLMGDGIMAFWGAPVALPNAAKSAIDCAIAMLERLEDLRARDARFADLHIGVGVHVGDVVVGNFGGARRFDYSAIGDEVNVASRFEGLTKLYAVPLITGEQTVTNMPDVPLLEVDL
ncbi:MAG TPA: adenylate/guanylate cyclase domain-containing protein, partial [Candidatus Binataceae bacterium]|nr:adenylate/guanylate cyclase domain-containing protein [Candidatus Binataceae bacterium]